MPDREVSGHGNLIPRGNPWWSIPSFYLGLTMTPRPFRGVIIFLLDPGRVNVKGGAVSLGHLIGASGARILTTLLYLMEDRGERYGVASLCIGGGEAVAVLVERT